MMGREEERESKRKKKKNDMYTATMRPQWHEAAKPPRSAPIIADLIMAVDGTQLHMCTYLL